MSKTRSFSWSTLYIVVCFILMYLPIFYLMFYSFNEGGSMVEFTGFTLDHYRQLFEDRRLMIFVMNTFIVAILSAFIATVIGSLGALAIYYFRSNRLRQTVLNLNSVLMVTPDVMMGASFLLMFSLLIPVRFGFGTVLLSHVAFNVPIVVLMVLPRLYEMNPSMITAALDLGANSQQILSRIVLPSIRSGILAGYFMAFTYSLDDFAVTFFVTGNGFSTLSVEVYSRARRGVSLEINALSTLMMIVALIIVAVYYFIRTNEYRRKAKKQRAKKGV
ncbi:spermidine/putrescine ABC transporter permease [Facklamia sp. HMSC062C11]|uniref:ABC transporter permease n=1 Tax=Facklamia hominis TaxID=178214 RepID=A0AAJ1Q2L3_9LACT|nr:MULTISPECIES: ABC transporter permease [Facklamia]MDK7186517.1 ABC transporter permease [Facklamia hominis]OFL67405.1 spermidine/putrescine ABC transporter permease [Facklamia sp. HMSC062C11]WPJ90688.1 ABC transporter permease [Facklamia hominis]